MRLSIVQQDVIDKMKAGWELGYNRGYTGRLVLVEGGVESGGQEIPIQHGTFNFLKRNRIIRRVSDEWPWTRWELTE